MAFRNSIRSILATTALVIPCASFVTMVASCSKKKDTFVDYAAETRIYHQNWKTSNFLQDGTGIVTLKTSVDGDTAHFYCGNNLVQGRFNGIDTPESTGILQKWGKQASNFTKDILTNAQTIVLETEPLSETSGPVQDGNSRYLVWVWASERSVDEEDGSQLYLVNLQLVQNGFSACKSASGSYYSDAIYNADLQAQKFKLHLYSNDDDPLFYEGEAITDQEAVFKNPENYVGQKVYLTGVVTRTLGTNAYFQHTFIDGENESSYGMYIFTQYKSYDILKKGNEIAATGTIAERFGAYQLINVSYSNVDTLKGVDDMTLLSSGNVVEPLEITAEEANTNKYQGVLVTIKGLTAYGGYGGYTNNYEECMEDESATKEYCSSNTSNAMTVYASQTVNGETEQFCIRIDSSTFIKKASGAKVQDYKYFIEETKDKNRTMDVTGIMSMYESESTGNNTVQLMLVATSDLVFND